MTASCLDPAELRSLRELTHGSMRQHISDIHVAKLISLDYARESADGLTITMLGRAVLIASLPDWPATQTSSASITPAVRPDQLHPE